MKLLEITSSWYDIELEETVGIGEALAERDDLEPGKYLFISWDIVAMFEQDWQKIEDEFIGTDISIDIDMHIELFKNDGEFTSYSEQFKDKEIR